MFDAGHASLAHRLVLGGDIDAACRIVTNQHHREAGRARGERAERGDTIGNLGAQPRCETAPVDDFAGGHATPPETVITSTRWTMKIRMRTTIGDRSSAPRSGRILRIGR